MQLQALLHISAQETCNQAAKVNSKSHYQWKRMIWCAHPMRCDQLPIGEWFNAWLELWETAFFRSPEWFLFSLQFSTQNCLEYNSFSNYLGIIPTNKNIYIQQLHHSTTQLSSSVSNKNYLCCITLCCKKRVTRSPYQFVYQRKKHVSTFTPSPKMALVCLASPLVTQPTHVARTGDILPSANLGMTGAERFAGSGGGKVPGELGI